MLLLWLRLGKGLGAWKWNWPESLLVEGPHFTDHHPETGRMWPSSHSGRLRGRQRGGWNSGPPAPATAPSWASSSVLWADGAAQVPIPLPLTCPWPASEGGLRTKCDPAIKSIPNQLFSQPTRPPQRGVPNPHLWG